MTKSTPLPGTAIENKKRAASERRNDRSKAGTNYGDEKPNRTPGKGDPSRGAELERDALPADGNFATRPVTPR